MPLHPDRVRVSHRQILGLVCLGMAAVVLPGELGELLAEVQRLRRRNQTLQERVDELEPDPGDEPPTEFEARYARRSARLLAEAFRDAGLVITGQTDKGNTCES